ncbi:uncharacterized protein LOC110448718 isoform X1 [Mizuhopecten yessoensis]|nr:uncharacterized protein LOC110448718 isoform X1 [Mizuhopecten yessoensis]
MYLKHLIPVTGFPDFISTLPLTRMDVFTALTLLCLCGVASIDGTSDPYLELELFKSAPKEIVPQYPEYKSLTKDKSGAAAVPYSAQKRRELGYTAQRRRDIGYTARKRRDLAYTADKRRELGYTARKRRDLAYTADKRNDLAYTADKRNDLGYTVRKRRNLAYTGGKRQRLGYTARKRRVLQNNTTIKP